MSAPELIEQHRHFDGWTRFYSHDSSQCGCPMRFAVYLPPQAAQQRCPVLYFLSGLTCTEQNFMVKAGAQRAAARHGLILVAPDTSPRGLGLPGEDDRYDFGSGAGFYLNARQSPWSENYRMYDYVISELPELIAAHFPADTERSGIFGHSMGGHGALVAHLRNPGRYRSVSAFSPICNPTRCPWGRDAFTGYLGPDEQSWQEYDATHLVRENGSTLPILIDQGLDDEFLSEQLHPQRFATACKAAGVELTLREHPGYDHSYYFIASFIEDHINHHAKALNAAT
ncbi:MAG: S-formylglutathione hydrolase [Pseudomonadota bacterium]|nr:S-formylglutathione hydrolase [Pseudomonadota bacterium]